MNQEERFGIIQKSDLKRLTQTAPAVLFLKTSSASLRLGICYQLLSIVGICLAYIIAGGRLFSYSLEGAKENVAADHIFRFGAAFFSFLHIFGTLLLAWFQVLLSDDTAWARGFRSGSKILSYAVSFDLLSGVIQFVLFLRLETSFSPELLQNFSGGGPEWLLTAFARILHAISLFLYGQGFFLLETFHDEGTSDINGIFLFITYNISGLIEILSFIYLPCWIIPITCILTLSFSLIWAIKFESIINHCTPLLHETELTNDIEQKVNRYALMQNN